MMVALIGRLNQKQKRLEPFYASSLQTSKIDYKKNHDWNAFSVPGFDELINNNEIIGQNSNKNALRRYLDI